MSSVITLEFEHWKAQEAATGKPVILDEFVFALIPNLDPSKPIDRNESLPEKKYIVDRQAVNKAGLASENAVAYSVTLGTDVGDYDFNWIGLLNKATGTVAMITHAPIQKKLKTKDGQQGNVLTRSFLLEFDGAARETAIITHAETWQIDFTARLTGIDEQQRIINTDTYGEAAFFSNGFLTVRNTDKYTVTKGIAYIGGLRGELKQDQIFNNLKNTFIYADFSFQGGLTSQWQTLVKLTPSAKLDNYIDNAGFQHFVYAIAKIDATGNVTDLRPKGSRLDQDIELIKQQYALKSEMKSWRMTAAGGEEILTPNYAFQSCLLFINGLDQYASYSFNVENNVIYLAEPLIMGDLVEVLINVPLVSQRALIADTETEQLRQEVEGLRNTVNNLKGKDFISHDKKNLVKAGSDEGIYLSEDELQKIDEIEVITKDK
nr:phage tail protein [Providencia rettgeri]